MDKNTIWFRHLAEEACSGQLLAIPYVGRGDSNGVGRIHNPPAEHMEITLVTSGHLRDVDIGGHLVNFQEGKVHLHNVHFGNYSQPYTNCNSWCIVFDVKGRKKFSSMKSKPFFTYFTVARLELLVEAFSDLMFCCNSTDRPSGTYFGGPILFDPRRQEDQSLERRLSVSAALMRFFDLLIQDFNSVRHEQLLPNIIRKAQNFVVLNFQNPEISLEDIASDSDISTNHLGLLFRRYLQTTPMRYLKRYRLGYARNLLARTKLSVSEVSRRVGFKDQLHFSREYHKQFGFPPTQTRRCQ